MDKLIGFIGRSIYGLPFLIFGIINIVNADTLSVTVPAFIPGGVLWIYVTGVAMIVASLAIVTGRQGRGACFGIALMLLVFILVVHLPGLANPLTPMTNLMNLLKDISLMGGALVIAGTFKK
jgi:uncharacterized membrane protein YphA (DoxX/SURF4 family)